MDEKAFPMSLEPIDSLASERKPRFSVLGSCVTRDPLNQIISEIDILSYQARTCITSMMSDPVEIPMDFDSLDAPPFEIRCVKQDLDKSWNSNFSDQCDIIVMDFIDERFGLAMIGKKIFTYSTSLRRLLEHSGTSITPHIRFIPPLSVDYETMLRANLPAFCDRISGLDNLLINDATWAKQKEDGSFFEPEELVKVEKSNRIIGIICEEIAKKTSAQFTGFANDDLIAKFGHRWGDAPFHYSDETEARIAEVLFNSAEERRLASNNLKANP